MTTTTTVQSSRDYRLDEPLDIQEAEKIPSFKANID